MPRAFIIIEIRILLILLLHARYTPIIQVYLFLDNRGIFSKGNYMKTEKGLIGGSTTLLLLSLLNEAVR